MPSDRRQPTRNSTRRCPDANNDGVSQTATSRADRSAASTCLLDLERGAIVVLDHVGDAHAADVLRSLGLSTGARFRVCRLGDPCIIQVRTTRIGLSRVVAESVYVVVAESHEP